MAGLHAHSLGVFDPDSLVEIHLRDIHGLVRRTSHSYKKLFANDEVEDLCQEIILLLIEEDHRRLRSFDGDRASFNTWLAVVVRNHVSNYAQKRKRTQQMEEVQALTLVYSPAQESSLISENLIERLRAIIVKLSDREQQLFELLYSGEASAPEAAHLLGIKVSSIYKYKRLLIEKLRRQLENGST